MKFNEFLTRGCRQRSKVAEWDNARRIRRGLMDTSNNMVSKNPAERQQARRWSNRDSSDSNGERIDVRKVDDGFRPQRRPGENSASSEEGD